jgi:predicted nucleic acid-binding protein
MSSLVLIDSSAWIFTLGAKPVEEIRSEVESLVQSNKAAITSPILFELLSGERSDSGAIRLASYLAALHPFPFTSEDWIEAAEWTRGLRRRGLKVKSMDGMIAFKAMKHGLTLLHADSDMDRIAKKASLSVESFVHSARSRS